MIHQSLGLIFRIKDGELGEDTNMGSFQSDTSLQKTDHLIGDTQGLVMSDEILKFIRVDDDVHTSNIGKLVLLGSYTSHTKFLPCLWSVGLLGSLNGNIELLQMNQTGCDFRIVFDDSVQDFSSLI